MYLMRYMEPGSWVGHTTKRRRNILSVSPRTPPIIGMIGLAPIVPVEAEGRNLHDIMARMWPSVIGP